MIIVLKKGATQQDIDKLTNLVTAHGVQVNPVIGTELTILGLVGDTSQVDPNRIESFPCVERIMHVAEPFKKANRMFHPEDTVVDVAGVPVGGKRLAVMAGPCSVESREQVTGIAQAVKQAGANILRGGAFKPRTSPYAFQGLKYEGLELLCAAREATGLPIVSEIMSPFDLDVFVEKVDLIQVGARNMQNFDLLRQLGRIRKPILLKRGLSATIEEWLMSAEYILAEGNPNVILCERGIRTFETYTRNTVDLGAIPAVKKLSHLPVIVDPSHGTGKSWMVEPLARAAVAVGADGVMIEVHNDPQHALCDGQQSITPDTFAQVMADIRTIAGAVGRSRRKGAHHHGHVDHSPGGAQLPHPRGPRHPGPGRGADGGGPGPLPLRHYHRRSGRPAVPAPAGGEPPGRGPVLRRPYPPRRGAHQIPGLPGPGL